MGSIAFRMMLTTRDQSAELLLGMAQVVSGELDDCSDDVAREVLVFVQAVLLDAHEHLSSTDAG